MTTTEAIAATIAAHTPIGTRYQLVAVCTNCGGAHHVQRCGELRAALTDDVTDIQAQLDRLEAIVDKDAENAQLRAELEEERELVDLLIDRIQRDDPELYDALIEDATPSARAWLRREAK